MYGVRVLSPRVPIINIAEKGESGQLIPLLAKTKAMVTLLISLSISAPTCSTTATPEEPTFQEVKSIVQEFDEGPVFPNNTKIEYLPLEGSHLVAAWVRVYSRMPPLELTLIRTDTKEWEPITVNKQRLRRWSRSLPRAVTTPPLQDLDARTLAESWGRLIVEPDMKYFRIIKSIDQVPVDLEMSPIYQEALRSGVSVEESRAAVGSKCPVAIAPPKLQETVTGERLEFSYWHFFGGEVASCEIHLSKPSKSKCVTACSQVGSYGYYH